MGVLSYLKTTIVYSIIGEELPLSSILLTYIFRDLSMLTLNVNFALISLIFFRLIFKYSSLSFAVIWCFCEECDSANSIVSLLRMHIVFNHAYI